MSMLRKDAQRAERSEDESDLAGSGEVPDEEVSLEPETPGGLKLTIMKGSGVGQTFPVGKGRRVIGTDVRCGIRLKGAGIAPRHVAVFTCVGQVVAEDLGAPGGTWVNGQKIQTRPLAKGDTLRVGDCELLVHR
jgi:pSer/pThr/pTyr-binding forkhead associated (FHA) protein